MTNTPKQQAQKFGDPSKFQMEGFAMIDGNGKPVDFSAIKPVKAPTKKHEFGKILNKKG